MYYPKYNGFPPVHLNLSLYQDLLKNFPFGSGEEFQAFLNATNQSQASSVSNATNQSPSSNDDPLSSTFAHGSASRPKKNFWSNLSFARKSYKVNPPTRRTRVAQKERSCSIEMNPLNAIFEQRKASGTGPSFRNRPSTINRSSTGNRPSTGATGTTDPSPTLPTSLVNENALIHGIIDDGNLDEIGLADDADVHVQDNNS